MNAVILAGGFGSRLMPLTKNLPKPMLEVANYPMIDYCFSQLDAFSIKKVVLTLSYLPEKIIDLCNGYIDLDVKFSVEEKPLGTGGGVKAANKYLSDTFFVLSGDGLNNIDLNELLAAHNRQKADVTIAITRSDKPHLYGVVNHDGQYVTAFKEKPKDEIGIKWVNTGIYVVNKTALDFIDTERFDFSKDLFPRILEHGKIGVYEHTGYWNDIGDISSYFKANFDLLSTPFYPHVKNVRGNFGGIKMGYDGNCLVSQSASVVGRINSCIVGNNARIANGAWLNNCLVLPNTTVTCRHNDCIIGKNFVLDMNDYALKENSAIFLNQNF